MNRNEKIINSGFTDRMIEVFAKHPYIAVFMICMFVLPISFGSVNNVPVGAFLLITVLLVIGAMVWGYMKSYEGGYHTWQRVGIVAAFVLGGLITAKIYSKAENKALFALIYGSILLLLLYNLFDTKKYKQQKQSLFIMGLSFLVKFYYIFCTEIYTRQHDMSIFGAQEGTGGHAGYIEYLWKHHHLVDADPTTIYGFYHPPLHYAISALWLEGNINFFGVDFNRAAESLQTLTLFYSMLITIIAYRIFRFFKLEGKSLYAGLFIVAFHPTFILLSGSINNDILATVFIAGAVLCTLQWYQERNIKNIIKIALCVGLGMMTKLSAALVAPPIALLFLYVFIKKFHSEWKKLMLQYGIFGIISIPLGMWYGIRNFIKWGVSFTYVQELPVDQPQYLGGESVVHRLFDFSPYQFSSVYEQWLSADPNAADVSYNEHNPLIVLLKNSMFGEFVKNNTFQNISWANVFSVILFWTGTVLALLAFVFMIFLCIKERKTQFTEKLFIAVLLLTMLTGYYQTAFKYPFVCTMDFRYIPFTVVIGALFYGSFIKWYGEKNRKKSDGNNTGVSAAAELLFWCTVLFAVMASVVMIALCLPDAVV